MEKKQTALNWLINEHFGSIENCTPDFRNKIKQAKEMERNQIIEAHGIKESWGWKDGWNWWKEKTGEQYYNETFKSE